MERRLRRYVPGPEGLEARMVLSTVAAPPAEYVTTASTSPAAQQVAPAVVVDSGGATAEDEALATATAAQRQGQAGPRNRPLTPAQEQARQEVIQMRMQRIDRLPAFLQLLDPGLGLPDEAIATIQQELRGLVGQLRPPAQPVAEHFVGVLRDAIGEASISPATVSQLNHATERLLESAGATQTTIDRIVGGLTELSHSAVQSRQPVVVMTNDYALVLQTTLGVGRPVSRLDIAAQTGGIAAGTQVVGGQPGLAGNRGF